MSVIFARAPLRISLGGGGTDLPSYYRRHGGFVIGGAIDKYVYMVTHTSFQRRYRMKYSDFEEVDAPGEIRHPILREAIAKHWRGDPLEIAVVADVPAGTGLGSSGAFTVCLLKTLALGRRQAASPEVLAADACEVEIDLLGEPAGKQDQYVAAYGGICAFEYRPDETVEVTPLDLSAETLDRLRHNLLAFYTGETRPAWVTLADQRQRTEQGDQELLENLHRTKQLGLESRRLLESGDLDRYAEVMHDHWQTKRVRSQSITNERVDTLYTLARRSGAIGGKLVGAGGGGFLLVYTPRPDDTRQAMRAAGAPELSFDFEFQGAHGVEYR